MAFTHPTSQGKGSVFALSGLAIAAALAAGIYWFGAPSEAPPGPTVSSASASGPSPAASTPDASPSAPASPNELSPEAARTAIADLQQASQALARQPALTPITGPVTARPAYVSAMEWDMLKGLASQHAAPEQELTRLVNSLRFNKQFEAWEALPRTDTHRAQRQTIAQALVSDLPERVRHQDMGLQDAQKAMTALLADVEPDEERRKVLAKDEGLRLLAAVPRNVTPP